MNFELLIENNIKQLNLKRVRIKVDPKLVCQTEDLSQCDGYEGYILAETGDVPKVLVMSPDGVSSVMNIPQQFLQVLMSDEESEILRAFKEYICNICEIDTTTPEAEILLNASTIEEVEAVLKQVGLSDDELKVLYRNFIIDNDDVVSEGTFNNLLNKAKSAASNASAATLRSVKNPTAWIKGASNIVKGAGAVYGTLIGPKGAAALTNAGNKLGSLYKSVKDKNLQNALKKLSRPPDGKDFAVGDKVAIQLPIEGNINVDGTVTKVQGDYTTDRASIVTIAINVPTPTKESAFLKVLSSVFNEADDNRTPADIDKRKIMSRVGQSRIANKSSNFNQFAAAEKPQQQTELPIDSIVITDTGEVYTKIKYFKNGTQISDVVTAQNKWPAAVGLHKVAANSWVINSDTKDDKLSVFANEIAQTLARPEVREKFKDVTDQKIKLLSQATSKAAIKGILGLNDARFNELLGYWIQKPNPVTAAPAAAKLSTPTPTPAK